MDISKQLAAANERAGLPAGTMEAIFKQETGGNDAYIKDPAKYHYELNKEGKRIAGHTGKVSTAFGPFGILESTAADPGYGVKPLKSKSLQDQIDFASDYLAARSKAAGGLAGGLAGYGEGAGYAQSVAKRMGRPGTDIPAVAPRRDLPAERPEGWPVLPTARSGGAAVDKKADQKAQQDALIAASGAQMQPASQGTEASTDALVAAAEAVERQRQDTGFSDAFQAGRRDPRIQPMFTMLDAINRDPEVVPADWSWAAIRDKESEGLRDDEREFLDENATGPQRLAEAKAQLAYRRGLDEQYGLAGGFTSFAGQMAAGMMDPVGFALGMGAGKALQGVGIGSRALANAGRAGAARASFLAENALANVSVEVLQDTLGEVKTSGDYVMAAASGVALAAPFAKGAGMPDVAAITDGMKTQAIAKQVEQIDKVVGEGITDPVKVAREVERQEIESITEAAREVQAQQIREPAVPVEVQQGIRDEWEGKPIADEPDMPTMEPAPVDLPTTQEKPLFKVELPFEAGKAKPHGDKFTVAEVLDQLATHPNVKEVDQGIARYFNQLFSKGTKSEHLVFDPNNKRGNYKLDMGESTVPGKVVDADVQTHLDFAGPDLPRTILHEFVHQSTAAKIEAYMRSQPMGPLQNTLDQFHDLSNRYREHLDSLGKGMVGDGQKYAAKNLHEFAAQALTDPTVRLTLENMPGKPVDGWTPSNAWQEMLGWLAKMLGLRKGSGMEEATKLLDTIISTPMDIRTVDGMPVLNAPGDAPRPKAQPASGAVKQRQHLTNIYRHAEDFVRRNPIKTERLKVLTAKIGGMSDGLVLAASENPIMKMVAALVTETTTGAAGRKPTVALRTRMLRARLLGDAIPHYTREFDTWAQANGSGVWDKVAIGDARRKFDKAVYTEIISRRDAGYQASPDATIVRAADALEKTFGDARQAQVDAAVLGANALPESSRGYIPQALDGNKLQTLSTQDLALLHSELASQFSSRLGWRVKDAQEFAPYYTDRIRKRAQGSEGIDGLSAGGDAAQVVRDALDDMTINPAHRDKVSAMSAIFSGQDHTKKRLDLDLRVPLREGLDLMDLYVTDPLGLARSYTHRVAGNVALTESGILGIRGIRQLREAAGNPVENGTLPTKEQFDAFDRVMAEIMGTPVAGRVVSAGATNLGLLVNLQKLGGLVWTQAAETYQLVNVLGLRSAMGGVASLPRMLGEVKALKQGTVPANSILRSIEQYGGEFGAENYKMVAPLDPPDAQLGIYMDQSGLASRLLRAGGHLQSKISGFRALMAAQHRMAAEQVTMKAARFIRDGGSDVALQDMGFTDAVINGLKADLDKVAKWDANGNLESFDLTQVSDPAIAEAFVQSVHRGVSQIIQGTYIGERSKWMHNDYLRLMLQLRTFGLTAAEKQWGRSRMNHGVTGAAGRLLGHMAMVLPIHMARVAFNAQGREDKEKFLKDNLGPVALARATMNYASLAGLAGDVMDIGTGIWAGVGDDQTKELLGARTQGTGVAQVIPAAGFVDQALKTVQGKGTVYSTLKQAPFGSLWWMVPAVNLTKEE